MKRNDADVFQAPNNGKHTHKYTLPSLFPAPAPVPPEVAVVLGRYVDCICAANLSMNQAVSPGTVEFMNGLIRYGFTLGKRSPKSEPEDHLLLPKLKISDIRTQIMERDANYLRDDIRALQGGLLSLSMDASTMHMNHILDFVLLSPSRNSKDFRPLLFDSVTIVDSTREWYQEATIAVLDNAHKRGLEVVSIVGDGFVSQQTGLSPEDPNSIQNDPELCMRYPWIAKIYYIYCRCHLANLTLSDAMKHSTFFCDCRSQLNEMSVQLRKKVNRAIMCRMCPKLSSTRWCHDYLLCAFVAKHRQQILETNVSIPDEILAYGMILEPLFQFISACESRSARFYMLIEMEQKFSSHIIDLANKYDDLEYVSLHCRFLQTLVTHRLSLHNHDLAMVADELTSRLRRSTVIDGFSDVSSALSFLDHTFENRRNEEAMAAILVETVDLIEMGVDEEADEEAED
jgi:hypothetical protein